MRLGPIGAASGRERGRGHVGFAIGSVSVDALQYFAENHVGQPEALVIEFRIEMCKDDLCLCIRQCCRITPRRKSGTACKSLQFPRSADDNDADRRPRN